MSFSETPIQVLIVDDDEFSLDLLQFALEREGYEVLRASTGDKALEILAQTDCRLVVSDWDMPGMTGIELCQTIRREDMGRYIYIILLTSHRGTEHLVQGMSAGADDFISKPFHPGELGVRVRTGKRIVAMETRDMAIFALAKLAESRDPETGCHLERVQCYSRALAVRLGQCEKYRSDIDAEFIRLIYLTSPLHDIGKVGLPDAILLKPGRLSDDEFAIMKMHTTLGAETLDAALQRFPQAKFLRIARDIAASHHERWDGRGYPNGLAGANIPLSGRIVALADVYDALTSKRIYKDAFSHVVARNIIAKDSGSHFDPDVVEAFLAIDQEFVAIRTQFAAEPKHAQIVAS
jgi:putative two-component system response regulator